MRSKARWVFPVFVAPRIATSLDLSQKLCILALITWSARHSKHGCTLKSKNYLNRSVPVVQKMGNTDLISISLSEMYSGLSVKSDITGFPSCGPNATPSY